MTEREREARRLRLLLARIERDRKTAYVVYDRVRLASDRVRETVVDTVTVGAVVLYLQNLYTALEELLRRVAAELDGWIPGGDVPDALEGLDQTIRAAVAECEREEPR